MQAGLNELVTDRNNRIQQVPQLVGGELWGFLHRFQGRSEEERLACNMMELQNSFRTDEKYVSVRTEIDGNIERVREVMWRG